MIRNYRDHAANERTYLAWIRTAITVMTLGFLVEKFDLFLSTLAYAVRFQSPVPLEHRRSEYVSMMLVALGIVIILLSTYRYFRTRRELEGEEMLTFRGLLSSFS
ncbi:MAG: YidH family protein [Pseudomonadota bacterium]